MSRKPRRGRDCLIEKRRNPVRMEAACSKGGIRQTLQWHGIVILGLCDCSALANRPNIWPLEAMSTCHESRIELLKSN